MASGVRTAQAILSRLETGIKKTEWRKDHDKNDGLGEVW